MLFFSSPCLGVFYWLNLCVRVATEKHRSCDRKCQVHVLGEPEDYWNNWTPWSHTHMDYLPYNNLTAYDWLDKFHGILLWATSILISHFLMLRVTKANTANVKSGPNTQRPILHLKNKKEVKTLPCRKQVIFLKISNQKRSRQHSILNLWLLRYEQFILKPSYL